MWYIIIVVMLIVALYVAYRLTLFVDARLDRQAKANKSTDQHVQRSDNDKGSEPI